MIIPFTQAFNDFLLSRHLAGLSGKTVKCYTEFIFPFVKMYENRYLEDLTRQDIDKYLETLYKRDLSQASRATYIRHIKIFLRWCEEEYAVDFMARKIRVPKSPKKVVYVYDNDEICQIFQAVRSGEEWLILRNRAVIALMLDSGLRQNEVCQLDKSDVHYNQAYIRVGGKGDKERYVPLGNNSLRFIKLYLAEVPHDCNYLFVDCNGHRITCNAIRQLIYKIGRNLPFEFSSHKLRHNFATNYCLDQYRQHGQVDAYRLMVLMGHEDLQTTMRYIHMANQLIAMQTQISHLDQIGIS